MGGPKTQKEIGAAASPIGGAEANLHLQTCGAQFER